FTEPQPSLERALGWDAAAGTSIAAPFSSRAFGHTGFTGTSLWIDPHAGRFCVLLTNRVHPTRHGGHSVASLRRAAHRVVFGPGREDLT
ncbi:MAG: serine hydrolase, partial [Trueperaceae bacterium]